MTLDAVGNALIAGTWSTTVLLGEVTLKSTMADELFAAKISPSGQVVWAKGLGIESAASLTVARDGTAWLAGSSLTGAGLTFIGKQLGETSSAVGFLIAISPTGEVVHRFGIRGINLRAVATAMDGDVIVAGERVGRVDLGGGERDCGGEGILIARLHPNGEHVWSTCGTARSKVSVRSVAAATSDLLVCGQFSSDLTLGTTIRPSTRGPETTTQPDLFVAAVDLTDGRPRWIQGHGGTMEEDCAAVVPIADGVLLAASGGNDLVGGPPDSFSYREPAVLRYTAAGTKLWGWLHERHIGSSRALAQMGEGSVLSLDDDDVNSTLDVLRDAHLVASGSLQEASGPLHGLALRAVSFVRDQDGTLTVAGDVLNEHHETDHVFVVRLRLGGL